METYTLVLTLVEDFKKYEKRKNMKKGTFLITVIAATLTFNCSNNSEDDLTDVSPVQQGELITYTEHIKPIIDNNCVFCHDNPPVNGAPNSLVNYQDVKASAENNLLDRISRQASESGAMPLGGPRLPQNSIDLVQQWIADGLLEN